ncbi:recombinase family protein [Pseudomonas japonica]|uniref:recombinase family protein n=1 Tax=Pseudomonas japonica TaxID=256466 RepID=UPI003A8464A8
MPKIWPYIRFSSEEQKRGDSLRRQQDLINRFAARPDIVAEGAVIDESLDLNDLGVSGYTGKNLFKGRFRAFLEAVDSGVVKSGDYLAVEALNRITRLNPLESLPLILRLVQEKGIRIAITSSSQVYARGDDISSLYIAIGELQRGFKESQEKGSRVKEAWTSKKKRAALHGEIATSRVPLWLRVTKSTSSAGYIIREIEEVPKRVSVVKEIFRLSDSNVGAVATARILTEKGIKTFTRDGARKNANYGDFWQVTYVRKILENRAVMGFYQPMQWEIAPDGKRQRVADGPEIAGYFPQVIEPELFQRVQVKKNARKIEGAGNKGSQYSNLFTKMIYCAACGATVHHVNKGKDPKKGGKYLVCFRAKYGSCNYKSWRYDQVEKMLLTYLIEADLSSILKERSEVDTLIREKFKLDAKLASIEEMLSNFRTDFKRLNGKVSDLEREIAIENESLRKEITACKLDIERKIYEALDQQKSDVESDIRELQAMHGKLPESEVFEIRAKINERLKLIIESMTLNFETKTAQINFKNGTVRYVHEKGVFANLAPPPSPEQMEKDMDEIDRWATISEQEKHAQWADEKIKIIPLKI